MEGKGINVFLNRRKRRGGHRVRGAKSETKGLIREEKRA